MTLWLRPQSLLVVRPVRTKSCLLFSLPAELLLRLPLDLRRRVPSFLSRTSSLSNHYPTSAEPLPPVFRRRVILAKESLPLMRLLVRDLKPSAVGIARIGGIATGLEPTKDLLFFDRCQGCCSLRRMSSIPQSAYAAAKVHMMMAEGNWTSNTTMARNPGKGRGNEKEIPSSWIPWMNEFMDHPLAKYNSKMMNSIWGLYNRYSVHNFKRVTEEGVKGKAGEWMAPSTFTFNQKLQAAQPNQAASTASSVGLPATAFPTASAPVRDANPLNSFWLGSHHH